MRGQSVLGTRQGNELTVTGQGPIENMVEMAKKNNQKRETSKSLSQLGINSLTSLNSIAYTRLKDINNDKTNQSSSSFPNDWKSTKC